MKYCVVCENEGVITCVEHSDPLNKFTKKQLIEIIEDIIQTKKDGRKL